MMVCVWTPPDVTRSRRNWPDKAGFCQIRVEKRKRGPTGFQLYMIWCLGCKSKNLGTTGWIPLTQNSALWLVLRPKEVKTNKKLKTGWTPLSFFNPNLKKHQPYMSNLSSIVWCQRGPPTYHHQLYVKNFIPARPGQNFPM